jgi:hypothetical protein
MRWGSRRQQPQSEQFRNGQARLGLWQRLGGLVRNHSQKAADAAFALNDGPRSIASSYVVEAEVQAHSTATVTTATLTDAECAQF